MSKASSWRTHVDPERAKGFGCTELHLVFFQPQEDPGGMRPGVALQVPETPPGDVRLALTVANQRRSRVMFVCDTAEQADGMAALAATLMPLHFRVSYERAEMGAWGQAGTA